MGAYRRLVLSGVVLASMIEGCGKISALIASEDETVEEDGDGFFNVRMQCTLKVCKTG